MIENGVRHRVAYPFQDHFLRSILSVIVWRIVSSLVYPAGQDYSLYENFPRARFQVFRCGEVRSACCIQRARSHSRRQATLRTHMSHLWYGRRSCYQVFTASTAGSRTHVSAACWSNVATPSRASDHRRVVAHGSSKPYVADRAIARAR